MVRVGCLLPVVCCLLHAACLKGDRRSAGAHGLGLSAFNMDTKYGRLALEKVLLAAIRRIQPEVVFPALPEGEDTKVRNT